MRALKVRAVVGVVGVAGVAGWAGWAGTARAGVVVEQVQRFTRAEAGFGPEDRSDFDGLGAWSGHSYVEWTDEYHAPGFPSWGRADMDSQVTTGPGGLSVLSTGSLGGFDGFPVGGVGQGFGDASVTVVFVLDAPTSAVLARGGYAGGRAGSSATSLSKTPVGGAEETVFRFLTSVSSWSGELAPGRYTLNVYDRAGWGGAGTGSGEGAFDVAFTVPAPATALGLLPVATALRRRRVCIEAPSESLRSASSLAGPRSQPASTHS